MWDSRLMTTRRLGSRAAAILAAVFFTACGELGETSLAISTGPGVDRGGPRAQALVGHWTRIIYFSDLSGALHASQTTWSFRPDGSATRLVITTNLSFGVSTTAATEVLWRTEGSSLIITFLSPPTGTVRFQYRIQGDLLHLGNDRFERVVTR